MSEARRSYHSKFKLQSNTVSMKLNYQLAPRSVENDKLSLQLGNFPNIYLFNILLGGSEWLLDGWRGIKCIKMIFSASSHSPPPPSPGQWSCSPGSRRYSVKDYAVCISVQFSILVTRYWYLSSILPALEDWGGRDSFSECLFDEIRSGNQITRTMVLFNLSSLQYSRIFAGR